MNVIKTVCISDINDAQIYIMMQSQYQLPKVSTQLGLVLLESRLGLDWIEYHLGSGSFFPKMKVLAQHQYPKYSARHLLHH